MTEGVTGEIVRHVYWSRIVRRGVKTDDCKLTIELHTLLPNQKMKDSKDLEQLKQEWLRLE